MNVPGPQPPLGGLRRYAARGRASGVARNIGKLWSAQGVVLVAGALQSIVAARWLGPERFGVVGLVVILPAFIYSFLDPQSGQAVIRFLAGAADGGSEARAGAVVKVGFLSDLVLAGMASLVSVALAPWAAERLVDGKAGSALVVLAAVGLALSAPATTARGVLTALGAFDRLALANASVAVVRTALVLAAAHQGKVTTVVAATAAGTAIEGLALGALASRSLRARLGVRWWRSRTADLGPGGLREMLRFMAYTDLASLGGSMVKQLDLLVLGYFQGPRAAGLYRLARSMTTPLVSLSDPLQAVVYPDFARTRERHGAPAVLQAARRRFLAMGLPVGLVVLVVAALAGPAIHLLAGPAYRGAALATAVLLAGGACSLAFFWVRPLFLSLDQVRPLFVISTLTAVLTSLAFLVGARESIAAVAAARAVVAGLLGNLLFVMFLRRRLSSRLAPEGGPP